MIKIFFAKPYNLFILTAILLFAFSFFVPGESLDFHLHGTYRMLSAQYVIWALSFILLLGWGIYRFIHQFLLSKQLTWIHVIASLALPVVLLSFNYWNEKLIPALPKGGLVVKMIEEEQQRTMKIAIPILMLFIIGQLAFIINLTGGLLKGKNKTGSTKDQ